MCWTIFAMAASPQPRKDLRPRLYLAAPLFSEAEISFNKHITARLEYAFEVYLPQRDGGLVAELMESGMPFSSAAALVQRADAEAILQSNVVLAVLDGRAVDEGVAFEIGFAHGRGIACFGLRTDRRSAILGQENAMLLSALEGVFQSEVDFIEWYLRSKAVREDSGQRSTEVLPPGARAKDPR